MKNCFSLFIFERFNLSKFVEKSITYNKFYLWMSFSQLIRRLFDMSKYLANSFKNIKVFFERINSNKFTTKILFCCFLSFYFKVNISVTLTIVINFYCKLNQSYNLKHCIMFACFLLQMNLVLSSAMIVLFLKLRHIVWILILF